MSPRRVLLGDEEIAAMSIREALTTVVTLVMMVPQVIAADLKNALECGATKSMPADDDPDPVFRTRIGRAVTGEIVIVHYAVNGQTYVRNDQYRDLRFWSDGKTDNWSGISIKRPDWTMVDRLQSGQNGSVGRIRRETLPGRQATEHLDQRVPIHQPRC
jgi:hypothetical protein